MERRVGAHSRASGAFRTILLTALAVTSTLGLRPAAAGEPPQAWTDQPADAGPRYGHVAVALKDGRVLVAGGMDDNRKGLLASTVVVDPARGVVPTQNMSTPRYLPGAALLGDGSVLVTGGYGGDDTAERYVPALDRWLPAPPLSSNRLGHSATLLTDGRLLVAGGGAMEGCCIQTTLASAEIYNPLSNRWTPAARMWTPRYSHTATLLPDGRVLVTGGNTGPSGHQLASAEIYDPARDAWSPAPDMAAPRVEHTATSMADGRILVAGGAGEERYWPTTEIFDPSTGRWLPAADMAVARAGHTATTLLDGRVLVAGGSLRWNHPLATAEIYDPPTGRWDTVASMGVPRYLHTATRLADRTTVAFVGGWDGTGATGDVALYRG